MVSSTLLIMKLSKRNTYPGCRSWYGSYGWMSLREANETFKADLDKYIQDNKIRYKHACALDSWENAFKYRTPSKRTKKTNP